MPNKFAEPENRAKVVEILSDTTQSGHHKAVAECAKCNQLFIAREDHITSGATNKCQSCREVYKVGTKLGMLTLTEKITRSKWKAFCTCGTTITISVRKDCEYKYLRCSTCRERMSRVWERVSSHKHGAKKRGFHWQITDEYAAQLIMQDCVYCNKKAQPANGIDRFDNTKGYTVDNSLPCCGVCNTAKNDMTPREFFDWLGRIRANSSKLEELRARIYEPSHD